MVTVRATHRNDRDTLLEWRNDPDTRSNSLSTAPITSSEHNAWFESVLADPHRFHYIGVAEKNDIGTVRFDVEGTRAEVSIMIAPRSRGRGLAGPLLISAIERFAQDAESVNEIVARVRVENAVSLRLFRSAHFAEAQRRDGVVTLSFPIRRQQSVEESDA